MRHNSIGMAAVAAMLSMGGVARATGSMTDFGGSLTHRTYIDGNGNRKSVKRHPIGEGSSKRTDARTVSTMTYFQKLAKQRTDAAKFGGDHRHDKYLHSHARRMRHMKLALAGKTLPKELTA